MNCCSISMICYNYKPAPEKTLLRMLEYMDALINRHGANIDILADEQVLYAETFTSPSTS